MKFELYAPAKINVGLNVLDRLPNGYHILDMVMTPISLYDILEVEVLEENKKENESEKEKKKGLVIQTEDSSVPTNRSNIIYKIYEKFYEKSGLNPISVEVTLIKNIPSEAGLGGGSSDGATFLKFLNEYHENFFDIPKLIEISASVGADIPFFVVGKTSRVRGIGDEIEGVENNLECDIVLIKPDFGISTKIAYECVDRLNEKKLNKNKKADIESIITGLYKNDIKLLENSIENGLEQGLLCSKNKNILEFREILSEFENLKFFMSGSGSAYYTFTKEGEKISKILKSRLQHCKVFLCKML